MNNDIVELWEFVVAPIYILLAFSTVLFIPQPRDRVLYSIGLAAKLLGTISFVFIYLFYYGGGDTIAYYKTALPIANLLLERPDEGFIVFFGNNVREHLSYFDSSTGFPISHIFRDLGTSFVSKITVPFLLLSFKSYLITSISLSAFSYFIIWKLFELVRRMYPSNELVSKIAFLFVPSVLFWGGGISKDTMTYSATCFAIYSIHQIFFDKRLNPLLIFFSAGAIGLILIVKPYIFLVLLPGMLVWMFHSSIQTIKNRLLRIGLIPIIFLFTLIIISFIYVSISDILGDYSTDRIVNKAIISQEDLKQDYYGGNSFDIGTIDPTIFGVLSKFPIATLYGFYSPTLLHVNSVVMLFSAIENSIILFLSISILILRNPLISMRKVSKEPFLLFCLIFSVLFAFGIGLTTPNFGALVRFKIPLMPFFIVLLFVLYYRVPIVAEKQH